MDNFNFLSNDLNNEYYDFQSSNNEIKIEINNDIKQTKFYTYQFINDGQLNKDITEYSTYDIKNGDLKFYKNPKKFIVIDNDFLVYKFNSLSEYENKNNFKCPQCYLLDENIKISNFNNFKFDRDVYVINNEIKINKSNIDLYFDNLFFVYSNFYFCKDKTKETLKINNSTLNAQNIILIGRSNLMFNRGNNEVKNCFINTENIFISNGSIYFNYIKVRLNRVFNNDTNTFFIYCNVSDCEIKAKYIGPMKEINKNLDYIFYVYFNYCDISYDQNFNGDKNKIDKVKEEINRSKIMNNKIICDEFIENCIKYNECFTSDLNYNFKIENCGIETNKIKNVNGNINFKYDETTKNCYIKSKENLELQNSK